MEGTLDGLSEGRVSCSCILAFRFHRERVPFFEPHCY